MSVGLLSLMIFRASYVPFCHNVGVAWGRFAAFTSHFLFFISTCCMRHVCCFETCHEQVMSVVLSSLRVLEQFDVSFCHDVAGDFFFYIVLWNFSTALFDFNDMCLLCLVD